MNYRVGIVYNGKEYFPSQHSTSYSTEFDNEDILNMLIENEKEINIDMDDLFDCVIIEKPFALNISETERQMLKEVGAKKLTMRNEKEETFTII